MKPSPSRLTCNGRVPTSLSSPLACVGSFEKLRRRKSHWSGVPLKRNGIIACMHASSIHLNSYIQCALSQHAHCFMSADDYTVYLTKTWPIQQRQMCHFMTKPVQSTMVLIIKISSLISSFQPSQGKLGVQAVPQYISTVRGTF